jgi:hypothetical protein
MAKNWIGLTLNGDVSLNLYAEAVHHFSELVFQLSREIGGDHFVEWQIIELESGSATAVVAGICPDIELVEKIVGAYENVGRALENKKPIPYSYPVVKAAQAITNLLNGKISSVEFYTTDDYSSHITECVYPSGKPNKIKVYGTVIGLVETLSRRQTLRFILYDDLFNRGVKCFFEEHQRDMMRHVWDKRVTDLETGRPLEVSDVEKVDVISDQPRGSFRRARGSLPWIEGADPTERTIRRIRDEE